MDDGGVSLTYMFVHQGFLKKLWLFLLLLGWIGRFRNHEARGERLRI